MSLCTIHWRWLARSLMLIVGLSQVADIRSVRAQEIEALRIGVAESDITPPTGFPIAGYYHERLAEGIIDPLKAKAVVFEQGEQRAAMVVCDLTGISRDLCVAVRERVTKETAIPASAISISATHSHTAPDYSRALYEYHDKQQSNAQDLQDPKSLYPGQLIEGISTAIINASRKLQPVSLATGSAPPQTQVSFNRRFVMKDGSVQTWRKFSDPQVVRSAGPIDPEIGLVRFLDLKGNTVAQLANFALHLDTVSGMRWSADYPFFIEQATKGQFGNEALSIFGTGCCGDINHIDPQQTEPNKTAFIGHALGSSITSAALKTLSSDRLDVRHEIVPLPLQEIEPEELQRSLQILDVVKNGGSVEFLAHVAAYKNVVVAQLRGGPASDAIERQLGWGISHHWKGVGAVLPVEVQTICVGDELAIVFLPGEVFVDLGLAIKRASPYKQTLIIELSNCVETAYIPTRAAYAGGSYEVTNSTLMPGCGEMLVEASLRLLRESAAANSAADSSR